MTCSVRVLSDALRRPLRAWVKPIASTDGQVDALVRDSRIAPKMPYERGGAGFMFQYRRSNYVRLIARCRFHASSEAAVFPFGADVSIRNLRFDRRRGYSHQRCWCWHIPAAGHANFGSLQHPHVFSLGNVLVATYEGVA